MSKKKSHAHTNAMTEAQCYQCLCAAKDGLFDVINSMKYAWGYDNWVLLHQYTAAQQYTCARNLINQFRNSAMKRYALELIADIVRYSRRLGLSY